MKKPSFTYERKRTNQNVLFSMSRDRIRFTLAVIWSSCQKIDNFAHRTGARKMWTNISSCLSSYVLLPYRFLLIPLIVPHSN